MLATALIKLSEDILISKPFNLLFIFLEVQYQKQNVILCLTYEKFFGQFLF